MTGSGSSYDSLTHYEGTKKVTMTGSSYDSLTMRELRRRL